MERRNFIKMASVASVVMSVAPKVWSTPLRPEQAPLPIPALLNATDSDPVMLSVQTGLVSFIEHKKTPTFGINGDYLGPAIKVRRGQKMNVNIKNTLAETITMHWHGLEIPGSVDGGPHQLIKSGETWQPRLEINQPAATLWYHPHKYPVTSELVMKGLAGLLIIEDEVTDALNLPSEWGMDDIPLIIQDRRFKDNGEFDYELLDIVNVANGFAGNKVLINGAIYPKVSTNKGWVRFRILNGSNARGYNLMASDQRPLYVVASDGGLIDKPVKMTSLEMAVGERYEILVSTEDGKAFDLITLPVKQMGMMGQPFDKPFPLLTVSPSSKKGKGELPKVLTSLPAVDASKAVRKREFVFGMDERLDAQAMMLTMKKKQGMMKRADMKMKGTMDPSMHNMKQAKVTWLTKKELQTANSMNGKSFDMSRIDFDVKQHDFEHWVISQGDDQMLHPFHSHGCQFRVLSINGGPPAAHQRGWKDTIPVMPGGKTEILVQFNYKASPYYPYMMHCHILEHEDTGMMAQFTVS